MKVHHLNCATLEPVASRTLGPAPGAAGRMVCHCLLVETHEGLVLVDSGLGLQDVQPGGRAIPLGFRALVRPRLDEAETAARQVEALGFARTDVRHIVLTHLDVDHCGGLADFPHAEVHVHALELEAARRPTTRGERSRYLSDRWAHTPRWHRYTEHGEHWMGLGAVRALHGLGPEILLVPLAGHSRGHSAVAVQTASGWLLHAGDAYLHRTAIREGPHARPLVVRVFERAVAADNTTRRTNLSRLHDLARAHPDIAVLCSHDAAEFEDLRARPAP